MTGVATFYHVDPAKDPDDTHAPRLAGVTVGEVATQYPDLLVMWTETDERFSHGLKTPSPYCLFFWRGEPIINPYALFKPLPERPKRGE